MAENVSDDIIVRHLNDNSVDWGQTVLNKFVFDLKTLPLETGGGSPSTSGWGGWVDGFRLDPHEFPTAKRILFRRRQADRGLACRRLLPDHLGLRPYGRSDHGQRLLRHEQQRLRRDAHRHRPDRDEHDVELLRGPGRDVLDLRHLHRRHERRAALCRRAGRRRAPRRPADPAVAGFHQHRGHPERHDHEPGPGPPDQRRDRDPELVRVDPGPKIRSSRSAR